jgi:hypothetical protein
MAEDKHKHSYVLAGTNVEYGPNGQIVVNVYRCSCGISYSENA